MKKTLKEILDSNDIVIAPGVYDGLSAGIAKKVGFQVIYMSGAACSYSTLGKPDVGFMTMSEMVEKAGYIYDASELPIIADGDTGFGNYLNVIRTVQAYEKAGISCIQIEDQSMPKRCGHMDGKELVSAEEMVTKIKAACDARRSKDFLIMARTDARAVLGLDEALRRGHMYKEAGADALFIEAPQSIEEMKLICREFEGTYLLANMVEGGKTPILPLEQLKEIGYKIVIYPGACARVVSKALEGLYTEIMTKGDTLSYLDHMYIFGELNEILKLKDIKALEAKYSK